MPNRQRLACPHASHEPMRTSPLQAFITVYLTMTNTTNSLRQPGHGQTCLRLLFLPRHRTRTPTRMNEGPVVSRDIRCVTADNLRPRLSVSATASQCNHAMHDGRRPALKPPTAF